MFYISKKVGDKYCVVDTKDDTEELYYLEDLKKLKMLKMDIAGLNYNSKEFNVVLPIVVSSKKEALKMRMLTGTHTGYKGFDLKFDGDKVIALPLSDEFFESVSAMSFGDDFVLVIPDIVTDISDDFISFYNSPLRRFSVVLPKHLNSIGHRAFSDRVCIKDIKLGKIDVIDKGTRGFCSVLLNGYAEFGILEINVKKLEYCSLYVCCNQLYLPDIQVMKDRSIVYTSPRGDFPLVVHLGKKIKTLRDFMYPSVDCYEHQLMSLATVVVLDQDCKLSSVDLNRSNYYNHKNVVAGDVSSYIFLVTEEYWGMYKDVIMKNKLDKDRVVGILLCKNYSDLKELANHIRDFCHYYESYFSSYLKIEDLGSYKMLKLK